VGNVPNNNSRFSRGGILGESVMKQYRIQYWEDGGKYTTVIGTNNYESLRNSLKKRYNRFTIEEIK